MLKLPSFGRSASYDLVDLEDGTTDLEGGRDTYTGDPFEIGDLDDYNDEHDDEQENVESSKTRRSSSLSSAAADAGLALAYSRRPPSNYYCPLTLHLMEDPVLDGCGHCFDREAIAAWLDYHPLCPISRKPLRHQDLTPATALQERILGWRQQHQNTSREQQQNDTDSQSPLELMLLPQERKVLALIKFRKQIRMQQEAYHRCVWSVVAVVSLCLVAVTFVAIYVYDVELQGPL